MIRRALPLLLALAAVLAGSAPLRAAPTFRTVSLRVGGKVDRRVVFDVNGDGRADLLLFRGRLLLVYLQRAPGGFRRWPDQVFSVWRNAVLCEPVRLAAAGGPALVLAGQTGVFYHSCKAGRFQPDPVPLIRCATALGYPGEDDLMCRTFLVDVDGDGRRDVILPVAKTFAVWRQDEKGAFRKLRDFWAAPTVSVRTGRPHELSDISVTARYPVPVVGDWNGDRRPDFIVRTPTNLAVFLQRKGVRFPASPDAVVDTTFPSKKQKKAGRFKLGIRSPVLVMDLDGDGVVDVVKTQAMQGRTMVFLRKAGERGLAAPTLVARSDGWPLGALAPDLDRDGLPDLAVGHVNKIGVLGAVKIFLTKSVTLHAAFFLNRKGFAHEPHRRMQLTVPLRFATTARGFRLGTTALINFDGDFDGDGRRDLLVKTGFMRLQVYRGVADEVFSRKPFLAVEIPDSESYMWVFPDVSDLNGDGVSDLVLHYRDWEEKMDAVVLKLSEGKG